MKESMPFTVKAQPLLWVECNCYIGSSQSQVDFTSVKHPMLKLNY